MNKQELIDKAVDEWLRVGLLVRVKANKQILTVDRITEDNGVICSNFKAYCRTELEPYGNGWINGYKYGVEYETNGKKPDLPDDIEVNFKHKKYGWNSDFDGIISCKSACWDWSKSSAFRIVDERYKPAKPASEKSWHEKGEMPPVGVECEIWELDGVWRKVEVVAHTKKGLVVEWGDEEYLISRKRKFRPLKTERERLIDIIVSAGNLSDGMLADAILAAGFKAPEVAE